MTARYITKFMALSIAAASVLSALSPGAAQAQARDASDWVVPRTPDGHPDLQGNWSNATLAVPARAFAA